jgi:hypothetical protein
VTDHKNLATALAAFQVDLPKLIKDEKAKVKGTTKEGRDYDRSYGYADLAQVCETVLPVLGKYGLSITSKTAWMSDGASIQFALEVSLLHGESGERETAIWPLPDPRRVGPQDLGSAITYGRRYLTLALTGTYPGGEDDDGARAQASANQNRWEDARPQRPAADKPVSAPPAPKIEWTDEKIAEYHSKISSSDVSLAVKGYDWLAKEGVHERKIPVAGGTGDELTATQILAFRLADLAVQPDTDLRALAIIRANAEDRGLINVAVSNDTTLGEELELARDMFQRQADAVIRETVAEVEAAGVAGADA